MEAAAPYGASEIFSSLSSWHQHSSQSIKLLSCCFVLWIRNNNTHHFLDRRLDLWFTISSYLDTFLYMSILEISLTQKHENIVENISAFSFPFHSSLWLFQRVWHINNTAKNSISVSRGQRRCPWYVILFISPWKRESNLHKVLQIARSKCASLFRPKYEILSVVFWVASPL